MRLDDFVLLLNENIFVYFVVFIGILITMYPIIRKNTFCFIDPLFYAILTAVFANSIPVFLYVTNCIETKYIVYFLVSEFFFWLCFTLSYRKKTNANHKFYTIKNEDSILRIINSVFVILLIVIIVVQYRRFGFGLFLENRLEVFKDSGGFGVISHIIPSITTFCIFYSYHNLKGASKSANKIGIITLIIIGVYFILSGAKSSFLNFAFIYFFYSIYFKKEIIPHSFIRNFIIVAVVCALFIFSFNPMGSGFRGTLFAMAYRVVGNGDIYWYAFPNGMIEDIHPAPWLIDMFANLLYPLRILNYSDMVAPVGTQLVYDIYPSMEGAAVGANSRTTVWGYAMFNYCGIIFSVLWGIFLGLLMRKCKGLSSGSILGAFFAYLLYSNCITGITDPGLFSLSFFDNLIGAILITIIAICIGLYQILLKYISYEKNFN